MSWRTVVISSRCKLDTKMGHMVVRSYFGDGRVTAFLKTVSDHGYHVLLLDCVSREKLPLENRVTIDIDLCEF